ncbi:MAG: GNAT family N-acetyltransferase, partial [Verrucomicrobiota bacterium]
YAAQLIEDGSTIQASLGDCPQAVLRALNHNGHRNLGIHTGCFTDPMMDLMKSGVVNNELKHFQKGLTVATHCLGSQELYDFVHENTDIEMHGSEWANSPHRISQHYKMVAINGAREVDLTGQVVRDSRGHRFYGGIGATQDFIRGAAGSTEGRPIIALTSTSGRGRASRIVTDLSSGSGVCTSRGDVHYVVTEYGVANLVGQSIRQRVLQLVEIAHPKFQEDLLEGARAQGWIPKTFAATTEQMRPNDIDIKKVDFSGIPYILRPIHPSDMRGLQEFFYAQDEETIRLRYGYAMPKMDENTAYRMSSVDQSKDLAIGVFYRDHLREELRAVGRFYVDDSGDTAEVAFLVHERARRKGIAQFLLMEMAKIAKERGIHTFWASVLKRNVPMARMFMAASATKKSFPGEDSDEYWMPISDLLKTPMAAPDHGLGIYASASLLAHDTGCDHPESIQRYQAVLDFFDSQRGLKRIADRKAKMSEVTLAHTANYHDLVRIDIEEEFRDTLRTGDTAVCEDSYEVALQALGAVLEAGDLVMTDKLSRAFCAIRPPGHHASSDCGMGFCIFNHAAALARYLQKTYQIERVAILDWDVHHGNGTQDIFYDDPSVLYISTHQEGIFPNTGLVSETGSGDSEGTTYNFPLPISSDDDVLEEAWGHALPIVEAFAPELIILSAGFDTTLEDPMADFCMTPEGFRKLTRMVRKTATRVAEGRIVSILEGGYHPDSLVDCIRVHIEELK